MSAILVSNDFVPWGVLIPLLKDSNSALEALGWDLNDLPPVPASFLLTLSQITSIYSATVHHNPRYLLICLHGYCVLILNLPKKGSYLHWTFWPSYNTITDNREYCLQKNTIPRAALKATFQSLITQHWIREERKKTSSRHLSLVPWGGNPSCQPDIHHHATFLLLGEHGGLMFALYPELVGSKRLWNVMLSGQTQPSTAKKGHSEKLSIFRRITKAFWVPQNATLHSHYKTAWHWGQELKWEGIPLIVI